MTIPTSREQTTLTWTLSGIRAYCSHPPSYPSLLDHENQQCRKTTVTTQTTTMMAPMVLEVKAPTDRLRHPSLATLALLLPTAPFKHPLSLVQALRKLVAVLVELQT
jgi:hypothetical protein